MPRKRKTDVRSQDNEARKDELGNDPREVGAESAGQSGGLQRLSTDEDSGNESVEELSEQARQSRPQASRVQKMPQIIPSAHCTRTMNMGVRMTCHPREFRTGRKPRKFR